jgi:hypothetical protein
MWGIKFCGSFDDTEFDEVMVIAAMMIVRYACGLLCYELLKVARTRRASRLECSGGHKFDRFQCSRSKVKVIGIAESRSLKLCLTRLAGREVVERGVVRIRGSRGYECKRVLGNDTVLVFCYRVSWLWTLR